MDRMVQTVPHGRAATSDELSGLRCRLFRLIRSSWSVKSTRNPRTTDTSLTCWAATVDEQTVAAPPSRQSTMSPRSTSTKKTSQDVEKVLDIFIRVNSDGTTLSYSDLFGRP